MDLHSPHLSKCITCARQYSVFQTHSFARQQKGVTMRTASRLKLIWNQRTAADAAILKKKIINIFCDTMLEVDAISS